MNKLEIILIKFEVPIVPEGFGEDNPSFNDLINQIYQTYTKPLLVTNSRINLIELRNLRFLIVFESMIYIDIDYPKSIIHKQIKDVGNKITQEFQQYFSLNKIPYKQI